MSGLAEGTIRLHCRNAKTMIGEAVSRELLDRHPFSYRMGYRMGHSMKVSERHYLTVTPDLYDRVTTGVESAAAESAAVDPRTGLHGDANEPNECWGR